MPENKEAQENKNLAKRSSGKSNKREPADVKRETPKHDLLPRQRTIAVDGRVVVGWAKVSGRPIERQEREIKEAVAHVEKVLKRMGTTQRHIDRLKAETRKLIADMKAA